MDEVDLKVLFNDVDFCLRIRERGHLVVWTPRASLTHKTSISIEESLEKGPRKQSGQAHAEHHTMLKRWLEWIAFGCVWRDSPRVDDLDRVPHEQMPDHHYEWSGPIPPPDEP